MRASNKGAFGWAAGRLFRAAGKGTNIDSIIGSAMATRQPIVSVLGHVDHGKTSLLDRIRGSAVVQREAGLITQHIGATEVPIEHIYKVCRPLIGNRKFNVPGLLFIDTPGHQSFTSLRARGGSLADLAVLVIDINEGLKPQTIESIQILKRFKTPFIIAMNKIDLIEGWETKENAPFILNYKDQPDEAKAKLDEKMYKIIGDLYERGYSADRYDRIEDFTKAIAVVPISARNGEGLPDLLLVLIGLAQRFLEQQLKTEEGPAQGTILEVKEEKGLGSTLDVIIFAGTLHKGDTVILGTKGKPITTKVKAILKPRPLDEIRDPKDRFESVKEVSAAIGVKLMCQNIDGVVAGGPLRAATGNVREAMDEVVNETKVNIETVEAGVYIKADAIGSLEALAFECKAADIPIRKYDTGMISRKDIIDAAAYGETYHRVILGFNVDLLPEAKEALPNYPLKVFTNDVVYRLIEEPLTSAIAGGRRRRSAAWTPRRGRSSPSPGRSGSCRTACSAPRSRPSSASASSPAASARGRRCSTPRGWTSGRSARSAAERTRSRRRSRARRSRWRSRDRPSGGRSMSRTSCMSICARPWSRRWPRWTSTRTTA